MRERGFVPPPSREDLEYRVASLERLTRGLGIGQELTVGGLYALGRVDAARFAEVRVASRFPGGIEEAIANLGGSAGVVYADPGSHAVTANFTIPATTGLWVANGGIITLSNTAVVTAIGDIYGHAGYGQIVNSNTSSETAIQTPDGEDSDYFTIKDMIVHGNGSSGIGLSIEDARRWLLESVIIRSHGSHGLVIKDESWIGQMLGGYVINNGGDGVRLEAVATGGPHASNFFGVAASGNTGTGFNLNPAHTHPINHVSIIGGTVEVNDKGIVADNVRVLLIDNVYFEGNTTSDIEIGVNDHIHGAIIRNLGPGIEHVIIGQYCQNVEIDGGRIYQNGEVISIASLMIVNIHDLRLETYDDLTDPCRIVDTSSGRRGIRGSGNLLRNGNFVSFCYGDAQRPSLWDDYNSPGAMAKDTPPTGCSGNAAKITGRASGATAGTSQDIANLLGSSILTISAWVKTGANGSCRIQVEDGDGASPVTTYYKVENDETWKRFTFQHQMTGDATTVTVSLAADDDTDIGYVAEIQVTAHMTIQGWLSNALDDPDALDIQFSWDPGSLADGAGETKSVTVNRAALNDYVIVAAPYDLQDCTVTAYVQASNTVEVRLQNESGGTKDLASGNWWLQVIKGVG